MNFKRIIFTILLFISTVVVVNASSISLNMSCPSTAGAGDTITCSISGSSSGDVQMISANYSLGGTTYNSFTVSSTLGNNVSNYANGSTQGFVLNNTSLFSSSFTLGNLKVVIPSNAAPNTEYSIGLKNVAGCTSNGVDIDGSNVTKNVRIKSSVNTLSSLSVSGATLSPSFNSNTTSYSTSVSVETITISATATDSHASVTGTGSKTLSYGNNTFNIVVKSETGSEKTYAININRIDTRSDDNTLRSLTLSSGTLSPSFTSLVNSYTATVAGSVSKITVTATTTNSHATFVSGYGSREVNLNYGSNTIDVKVKSEKGTEKVYRIVVTRTDDRDTVNTLSALTLSNGTLSPKFAEGTLNYTATVESSVTKITINATKKSSKSSFISGYGSRDVNLEYGANTILIKIRSENEVEKIYKVVVTRTDSRSNNNYLGTLTVDDLKFTFNKQTTEYALTVPYNKESVVITATTEDSKATLTGIGTKELKEGANVFTIVVTAENSSTKTYKITITKLTKGESVSSNTNLKDFTIKNHSINFSSDVNSYSVTLNEDETTLDLSYLTEDESSVVTVNGNENLKNGSVVTVTVTSTDGSVKVYTINIVKKVVEEPIDQSNPLYLAIAIVSILIIIGSIISYILILKKKKANRNA